MPFGFTRSSQSTKNICELQDKQPQDNTDLIEIGTTIFSRYNITGKLSHGAFGYVYEGEDTFTKKTVALKVMTKKYTSLAIQEKSCLMLLNKEENKFVCRLLDFLTLDRLAVENKGKYVIVLPKYEKNLYEYIKECRNERGGTGGLSTRTQELVLSDVLNGLRFIHKSGIIHLDLKPENIMLSKVNLKPNWLIIDFGNAESRHGLKSYYDAVTPWYRAPEICVGAIYTEKADIWSLGCIIYEIQVGRPIFTCDISEKLIQVHIMELGEPPLDFLYLPLQPKTKKIKHVKCKRGRVVYEGGIPIDLKKHKSVIKKADKLTNYMYNCFHWMPSKRLTADVLYKMLQKEVVEGQVIFEKGVRP